MPAVEHTDDSVSSLVDVDSPLISSVPSDYESQSVKTDTQAERIEQESKAKEAAAHAQAAKESAKARAKKDAEIAKKNADNPVVIGNVAGVAVLGTFLGVGAYRKYVRNELTWNVVGAWAGVVGLFALGDYYVSNYFFKKYPPKK